MKPTKNLNKGSDSPKIRLIDGIVFRVMDKEAVVVKPIDGTMLILNDTATFILKNIGKWVSIETLIKKIMDEYETTAKKAEKDVKAFLKKLEKEGIIEIS